MATPAYQGLTDQIIDELFYAICESCIAGNFELACNAYVTYLSNRSAQSLQEQAAFESALNLNQVVLD